MSAYPDHPNPCSFTPGGTERNYCVSMDRYVHHDNAHNAGFSGFTLTLLEGEWDQKCFLGIRYRSKTRDKGTMLNFCPWCGFEWAKAMENTYPNGRSPLKKEGANV